MGELENGIREEQSRADEGVRRLGAEISTQINTDSLTHTTEEKNSIREYQKAVDMNLLGWVERVKSAFRSGDGTAGKMKKLLGTLTERTARAVKGASGVDVTGFQHMINGNAVRHIDLRHGENGKADHSMRMSEDLARVVYVLENFDNRIASESGVEAENLDFNFRNRDGSPSKKVVFSKK